MAEQLSDSFLALPGVNYPAPLRYLTRLDFGPEAGVPTHIPPVVSAPYPCLVPAVDQDGNEVGGIRMPYHTVPLATYTGWNLRHADIGGTGQILASGGASGGTLFGATIPFPASRQARKTTGDPRRSIAERYASKTDYLERVQQATEKLVQTKYLMAEDVEDILKQAAQHYDLLGVRARICEPLEIQYRC